MKVFEKFLQKLAVENQRRNRDKRNERGIISRCLHGGMPWLNRIACFNNFRRAFV